MTDDGKMTFLEHLEELRRRLIISVAAVFVGMIACWFFREEIMSFLLNPLYEAWRHVESLEEPKPLNFTSMLEPFVAYLKLSAVGGLFFASPVVLYQLWAFIAPGLYPKERRLALPFVLISSLLFVGGSIMAYAVVFPIGFKFFLEFAAGREMVTLEDTVTVTEPLKIPPMFAGKVPVAVDAGVAADAGPPTQTTPPKPAALPPALPTPAGAGKNDSWLGTFVANFIKGDCAELAVGPGTKPGWIRMELTWARLKCGEPPKDIRAFRDGERRNPRWHFADETTPDKDLLYATDDPGPGTHRYTVKFPKNPNEHRLAPVLMIKDYLSFAIRLLLAFGVIFELPILISFLAIAGIVNYRQLLGFYRYFLVISVIIGALLTPPDVVTQLLLATPLSVLYGLSIVVAYFFGEKPRA